MPQSGLVKFTSVDPYKTGADEEAARNLLAFSFPGDRYVVYVGKWFQYCANDRDLWNGLVDKGLLPDPRLAVGAIEARGQSLCPPEYFECPKLLIKPKRKVATK